MAKSERRIPDGVTKIEPDKITSLLETLIEISKDVDYQEYLISINEKILDSQERTEKIGKEISKLIEDFEPIATPVDTSPVKQVIDDLEVLMELYIEKTMDAIKEAIETIKIVEQVPEIIENIQEEQQEFIQQLSDTNEEQLEEKIDEAKKEEKKRIRDYALIQKAIGVVTKVADMSAAPADKAYDQAIKNVIGPLQLITEPLEDFFNVDFIESIKKGINSGFSGVSSLFSKNKKEEKEEEKEEKIEDKDSTREYLEQKIRPTKRDLLSAGVLGASAVYLADTINDVLLLEDKTSGLTNTDGSNILEGLFGGGAASAASKAVTSAMPALLKGLGIASLAGGILWGVFDGILAAGKAEEWGVSKITAGVAGFLGGSEGEGDIKNAFANAGKFAFIGIGAGTPFGPLGMLAGGIIGGVIGGVLGWVGGENIAKFFSWVGSGFTSLIDEAKTWITEHTNEIIDVKESMLSLISPIVEAIKYTFSGIMTRVSNIKNILGDDDASLLEKIALIGKEVIFGIIEVPYNFIKGGLAGFFGDRWKTMSDILGDDETTLFQKISSIAKEVFVGIIEAPINLIKKGFGVADDLIKLALGEEWEAKYESIKEQIAPWLGLIIDPIVGGVKSFFEGWGTRFSNIKDSWQDDDKSIFEKIMDTIGNLFLGIIEAPINYLSGMIDGLINSDKFDDAVSAIGSFFTSISDAIKNWVWSLLPGWAQTLVQGNGIGEGREIKENPKTASPDEQAYYTNATYDQTYTTSETTGTTQDMIDKQREFNKKSSEPKETKELGRPEQSENEKGFFSWLSNVLKGDGNTTNSHQDMVDKYRPVSVNDAVIYKDGKIIQPHPDDHIIATKENPFVVEKKDTERIHREIENNYFKEPKKDESQKKFDTMISILEVIADRIQKSGDVSVIQNTQSTGFNFNQLRMGVSK